MSILNTLFIASCVEVCASNFLNHKANFQLQYHNHFIADFNKINCIFIINYLQLLWRTVYSNSPCNRIFEFPTLILSLAPCNFYWKFISYIPIYYDTIVVFHRALLSEVASQGWGSQFLAICISRIQCKVLIGTQSKFYDALFIFENWFWPIATLWDKSVWQFSRHMATKDKPQK